MPLDEPHASPKLKLVSHAEPPLVAMQRSLDGSSIAFALCDETRVLGGNRAFEHVCGLKRANGPTPLPDLFGCRRAGELQDGATFQYAEDTGIGLSAWNAEGTLILVELRPHEAGIAGLDELDPVSRLVTPSIFEVELEKAVASALQEDRTLALFHIDFPQFGDIGRGRGGDARLAFLRGKGTALAQHAGAQGLATRIEGAHFALLLPALRGEAGLEIEMERLSSALSTAEHLSDGSEGLVRPRVGIALMPDDTDAALTLLGGGETGRHSERFTEATASLRSCADLALSQSLSNEAKPHVRFAPALVIARRRRERLALDVGPAVTNGDMQVAFQPVMDIATNRLAGFEALLRWRHPEYGPVPPPEAVAIAEANGHLCALTRHVMREAIECCAQWPEAVTFAVNVTPSQLNTHLVDLIGTVLAETGAAPPRLEIEVTEDALIQNVERSSEVIDAVRALGVRVAMDDFGAGFTSLRNLKHLAFDKIKIDRSLCEGLGESERSDAIVGGLVRLAARLGIEATVEGVETEEQLVALTGLPCLVQGYVFSPPVPVSGMEAFRPFLGSRAKEEDPTRKPDQRSRPASRKAAS